jgi:hypothetical protein
MNTLENIENDKLIAEMINEEINYEYLNDIDEENNKLIAKIIMENMDDDIENKMKDNDRKLLEKEIEIKFNDLINNKSDIKLSYDNSFYDFDDAYYFKSNIKYNNEYIQNRKNIYKLKNTCIKKITEAGKSCNKIIETIDLIQVYLKYINTYLIPDIVMSKNIYDRKYKNIHFDKITNFLIARDTVNFLLILLDDLIEDIIKNPYKKNEILNIIKNFLDTLTYWDYKKSSTDINRTTRIIGKNFIDEKRYRYHKQIYLVPNATDYLQNLGVRYATSFDRLLNHMIYTNTITIEEISPIKNNDVNYHSLRLLLKGDNIYKFCEYYDITIKQLIDNIDTKFINVIINNMRLSSFITFISNSNLTEKDLLLILMLYSKHSNIKRNTKKLIKYNENILYIIENLFYNKKQSEYDAFTKQILSSYLEIIYITENCSKIKKIYDRKKMSDLKRPDIGRLYMTYIINLHIKYYMENLNLS